MSINAGFCYRTLRADERWGYATYTFPALQHLLHPVGNDTVMAVGVDDAAGKPVGLALGRVTDGDGGVRVADVMSIYVVPALRRARIGTALLACFTDLCRTQKLAEIRGTYMTGQATTAALELLLARAGWTPPQTRMLVIYATLESISHAPWIRNFPMAEDMQIVRWLDLTGTDRAGIAESQREESWIPADLYPFNQEAGCEPITSLALKEDGHVVGWVINHRVGNVLRYTCAFVHPRLQRRCRILLLYNAAVARMPQAGFDTGIWAIPVWHTNHVAFARRWMVPYATRFDETRRSKRLL